MSERFVLAIVADLGGRRGVQAGRLRRVTRDTIDALPAALGVQVPLPDGPLDIRSLDDFHPENLARRLPTGPPPKADEAPPPARAAESPGAPDLPPPAGGAALLESILRTNEGAPAVDPGLSDFVRRVAEPFVVRSSDASDAAAQAERATAVRRVLDDPRVHELEAAWRALHGLVLSADDRAGVEVWVLDASPTDAPAALADELSIDGAPPVAVLAAAFRYGPDDRSLAALAGLATVAQATSIPLLADVDPRVLGFPDARALGRPDAASRVGMLDRWRQFRRHALAAHVCLCLPRVLARLPYGPRGEPVTGFPFDEDLHADDHERFLWSSAALMLASVMAHAFATDGWGFDIARYATVADLPVWVPKGEDPIPCAEVVMSTTTIRALVEQGCTVLASVRDEDRASFWGIGMLDGSPLPALG